MEQEIARNMFGMELTKSLNNNEDLLEKIQKFFQTTNLTWSKAKKSPFTRKSFVYLLFDPRKIKNIPPEAKIMQAFQSGFYQEFKEAIFFVGRGTYPNIHSHFYKALGLWKENKRVSNIPVIQHILDIWSDNYGVICLQVFQNSWLEESTTYQASLIDFIGLSQLKNKEVARYHDDIAHLPKQTRCELGQCLLDCAVFGKYKVKYKINQLKQLRPQNLRLKKIHKKSIKF